MSRSKWGLKNPEKFLFNMSPTVAMKFRDYCVSRHYTIGRVLEDLVIDHLIAEGVIASRIALANEQLEADELESMFEKEGKVITPLTIEREQQRAHAVSVIEAAQKEAEEFNSRRIKTGKEASRLS